jgi:hypothetical protein
MYNECIHEQKIYSGQILCQKHVYVDASKVHQQYQTLKVCFQSSQGMWKTRHQRFEQNMSMTTCIQVVTILFKITKSLHIVHHLGLET